MSGSLSDWTGLVVLLSVFVGIVTVLAVMGRSRGARGPDAFAVRVADGLERVTGIPGWAAAMVGTAGFGLLVAGMGFYRDVAWHVNLGRDEVLFTAPHSSIVAGLLLIFLSAFVGEWFASATKADVGLRWRGMRIPYSVLLMGLLGGSALAGFPADEIWHRAYGIDVTMWSPTHLLMIVGASLSPVASWLALAEARVRPSDSRIAGGLHIGVGAIALLGLSSVQGEFAFGVPQFQQLYHPVLYALAAGIVLTAVAVAVERWWALLVVAAVGVGIGTGDVLAERGVSEARPASLYLVAAVSVALVAKWLGTDRRLRFALASGSVIGTFGLAGEWVWNQGAHQPWGPALLPEGAVLPFVVAVASACIGVALGGAVRGERSGIARHGLGVAAVVVLAGLAVPFPRTGSDVVATIDARASDDEVSVRATLDPPDAAADSRWFQLMAWQGGGYVAADMVPSGEPGTYESDGAVPTGGKWKAMLRLHRGSEMVAVPVALPADAEIGAPEIAVADKVARFEKEQRYLLREQRAGSAWTAPAVYVGLGLIALLWIASFVGVAAVVARPAPATQRHPEMARI